MSIRSFSKFAALALTFAAGTASAGGSGLVADALQGDLYINEVFVDPSSDDNKWEYIELFGCPNQDLSGLAVVIITSHDDSGTIVTEIDESFVFPAGGKFRTNSSGFFVVWNSSVDNNAGDQTKMAALATNSTIFGNLPASIRLTDTSGGGIGAGDDLFDQNPRYEAAFNEIGTYGTGAAPDWPAQIENEGSLTVILMDYAGSNLASGVTLTSISKDRNPDGDGDGNIEAAWQVIDSVSFSDDGGHEYTFDESEEIDFSPDYVPDAMCRVDNDVIPGVSGTRDVDDTTSGLSEDYRVAYTNWVAGQVNSSRKFTRGFGGVNPPTTVDVSVTTLTDLDNYDMTPGVANDDDIPSGRGQIANPCARGMGTDLNSDGMIDENDLYEAIDSGDTDLIVRIFEAL